MAQLPTIDMYINIFLTSERRHRGNWTRLYATNSLLYYDTYLQPNAAFLDLEYRNDCNLMALSYHPPFPASRHELFQNNLWYDTTFNLLPTRFQTVVRRVMQYWTPNDWRGF
ncbi:hypothetical protein Xekk_03495 [Xenorhabdus sp. KK7.4]|nr:hypothetical protein Xekk_03495 [Xenorhabdus sp. KK7.4]